MKDYKDPFVTKLFLDYKDIPTDYKYLLIEKDYISMFGKGFALEKIAHLYAEDEDFIISFDNAVAEFSKTVKKNLFKKYCKSLAWNEYFELLKSGMFFEFFPNLSGDYKKDEEEFYNFIFLRENYKGWLDGIL
jgi:hypothetical protein